MSAHPGVPRSGPVAAVALLSLALVTPRAAAVPAEVSPELGRSFVVAKVSGSVRVKAPGKASIALSRERTEIPVGSIVNAGRGKVRLIGAVKRSGGRQAGVFYAGAFKATQARRTRALIDLKLVGGNFKGCDGASTAARQRLGRRLLGVARGRFRTRGNQAAATIRGTRWLTEDRCTGTAIASRQGKVIATSGEVRYTLESGDIFQSICTPRGVPAPDADYCLYTRGDDTIFAFALATEVHQGDYTVCVQPPTGDPLCKVYPLPEPRPGTDYRLGVGACAAARGAGTYTISWAVSNQFLGALSHEITRPLTPDEGEGLCPVSGEELQPMGSRSPGGVSGGLASYLDG